MKKYEQPALELIKFSVMEVLAASETSASDTTKDSSSDWDTPIIPGL